MLGRKWPQLPRIIRFMIDQFAIGAAMGALFGLVLIRTDTAGLGRLLEVSGSSPTILFLAQGAVIYGTAGLTVAIMTLSDNGDD